MPSLILHTSSKQDGNMSFRYGTPEAVLENRKRFLLKYGVVPNDCVAMDLQNGTDAVVVTAKEKTRGMYERNGIPADCLVTNEPGVFLFLFIGDCLPVALYDPVKSVVALAHFSRHNAGHEFAKKIVDIMKLNFGSSPKDILVTIGPGIHKESYIHPNTVPQVLEPTWQRFITLGQTTNVALDLVGITVEQLVDTGISRDHIDVSPINTAVSNDYFSHYRSVRTGEPEGRFATILGMK